jgi:hypothetical protein
MGNQAKAAPVGTAYGSQLGWFRYKALSAIWFLAATRREAEPAEANDHHRPSGRLGDSGNSGQGDVAEANCVRCNAAQ